jgi:hypothetical protein
MAVLYPVLHNQKGNQVNIPEPWEPLVSFRSGHLFLSWGEKKGTTLIFIEALFFFK